MKCCQHSGQRENCKYYISIKNEEICQINVIFYFKIQGEKEQVKTKANRRKQVTMRVEIKKNKDKENIRALKCQTFTNQNKAN